MLKIAVLLELKLWTKFNAPKFTKIMLCCYIYLFIIKCKILIHLTFNIKYKISIHLAFNARCKMDAYLVLCNYMICVIMIDLYTKKFILTTFMANGL